MLIDSNILVYAINSLSPKHKKAQYFLQQNLDEAVIAHQNILETLRVLTHSKFPKPMKLKKAIKAVETITEGTKIIYPDYKTYYLALELMKKHSLRGDQIFDAYLTATALSNNITAIATDNVKDFQKFEEMKVVNPFEHN